MCQTCDFISVNQVCFQQHSFTIKAVQSFLRRSCLESLPFWLKYFLLNHFSLEWWLVTCHLALFKKSSDKELWQGILYLKLQRVQEKQEQYFNKLHHLFSSSFFHVWNTREFKKIKQKQTTTCKTELKKILLLWVFTDIISPFLCQNEKKRGSLLPNSTRSMIQQKKLNVFSVFTIKRWRENHHLVVLEWNGSWYHSKKKKKIILSVERWFC